VLKGQVIFSQVNRAADSFVTDIVVGDADSEFTKD
jgi:hypothetical protein